MTAFVLVHGAFGSPAELAPVIPELEALGHTAINVDLPCTDPDAMLEDYVGAVVEAMATHSGKSLFGMWTRWPISNVIGANVTRST